jgi:hypothetical protein
MRTAQYCLLFLFALLTACDFETSDNGDLDGFWQLHQLDTLATGGSTDMRDSAIYWAVQVKLLEIRRLSDYYSVMFRFDKSGSQLRISNPVCDDRDISDSIITSAETLRPFGLLNTSETFNIETLNSDHFVITNEAYRFHLRKY